VSSVTYSLNGGSMPGGAAAPTQADTLQNTTFTVGNGTEPVKAGYDFGGWSDYWGTVYADGDSFLKGGIPETLTAVWAPTFDITYDLGGGAGTLPTHSPLTSGSRFDLASGGGLTREGYQFVGWSDSSATFDAGYSYEVVSSDVMLTAVWARVYSVTYDLGGGAGTLPTHSPVANGGSFQLASADGLTFDGYTFLHWSDGSDSYAPGDTYTVGESDVTLTAVWSVNQAPIPENVLPPGSSESDLGEPTNITLGGSFDTTLTLGSNGTNASITIPAGALPTGTTVSVYPVLATAGIADSLPDGQNFVVSLVVTWSAPDGSVPIAGSPLRMTIANSAIKSGDNVYQYVGGVLTLVGTATQDGTISFTFNEDPVFTVSTPDVTNGGEGGSGGTGGNGSGGADETGDPSDGITEVVDATETASGVALPYTGSNTNTPLGIALVLFTLGGAMVLGTRRKKASLVRNDENELIS
jgi:LPXTG-motif cell wall-anchored protein